MIEIVVNDARWREALPEIESWAARRHEAALSFEPRLKGEIAVALTGDGDMRNLNQQFRNKDKPTNVLAFPAGAQDNGDTPFLGDIAIGFGRCAAEAEERDIPFAAHASHLLVHGMLHLIGYDHQTDDEADAMERRETEILAALGVGDPHGGLLERKA